jgi:archaeosine synthase alpha-subunit
MAGLGRTVKARQRMARLWGLGDRNVPSSWTPGLVLTTGEDADISIAPFESKSDGGIPSRLTISGRAAFAPWESSEPGPSLSASIGHVLPPSLEEADAGEVAQKGELLALSWQALNHDAQLMNPDLNPHIVVLTDALQLANRPGKLVEAIQIIKRRFSGSLLWCPGIGGPDNCAVYSYFGVDLFDMTRSKQAESHGAVLTNYGPRLLEDNEGPNDHWTTAIMETRRAIRDGRLAQLARSQSLNSPRLVEHLRRHDLMMAKQQGVLAQIVNEKTTLRIHSADAHDDPIISDWVSYISNDYRGPEGLDDVLVLLPCSARKPYSFSRTHRSFRRAMNHNAAHEVIVTSPLGLVPRELEECWPAGHYDIPVTGDWNRDEVARVTQMLDSLCANHNFRVIINHSGLEYVHQSIEVIDTRQGEHGTSHSALERLGEVVLEHLTVKRRNGDKMNMDKFRSVAKFHYLNDNWLEGCIVKGRIPRWKLFVDNEQIAMWAPERAGFSLSKASIPILDRENSLKRITLKAGIKWKGDVNLTILDSYDKTIKSGEDLLVMQEAQCIGLARAQAPAWEWAGAPGRLAKMHQRR